VAIKMNSDTVWNLILIVSILLIINGMSDSESPDKKTAQAGQGQGAAGGVGVASFIAKKANPLLAMGAVLSALFFAPNIISNWVNQIGNLFSPSPSIPGWVWIAGFFVLLLLVLKKK
jgi:hypothetical protein